MRRPGGGVADPAFQSTAVHARGSHTGAGSDAADTLHRLGVPVSGKEADTGRGAWQRKEALGNN